jgi:hypothetical protein
VLGYHPSQPYDHVTKLMAMAQEFGVPVVTRDELAAEGAKRGEPVSETLRPARPEPYGGGLAPTVSSAQMRRYTLGMGAPMMSSGAAMSPGGHVGMARGGFVPPFGSVKQLAAYAHQHYGMALNSGDTDRREAKRLGRLSWRWLLVAIGSLLGTLTDAPGWLHWPVWAAGLAGFVTFQWRAFRAHRRASRANA